MEVETAPITVLNVPDEQGVQATVPEPVAKPPAGQFWQVAIDVAPEAVE